MSSALPSARSRWRRVGLAGAVLLVGAVVPIPFGRRPEFDRFGPDKLLHLVGHGAFAAVTADALGAGDADRGGAALAVCLSIGYALLLGWLQELVPGREAERADLAASLLGSLLGVAAWLYRSGDPRPAG